MALHYILFTANIHRSTFGWNFARFFRTRKTKAQNLGFRKKMLRTVGKKRVIQEFSEASFSAWGFAKSTTMMLLQSFPARTQPQIILKSMEKLLYVTEMSLPRTHIEEPFQCKFLRAANCLKCGLTSSIAETLFDVDHYVYFRCWCVL